MPVIVAITAWNNGATSLWCSVTYGSEGRLRSDDLRVMSPARSQKKDNKTRYILGCPPPPVSTSRGHSCPLCMRHFVLGPPDKDGQTDPGSLLNTLASCLQPAACHVLSPGVCPQWMPIPPAKP